MNDTGKPVALVLGGTAPHKEVIRQLKARGFYTVLVDYLEDPPARTVADEHIRESTLDKETVFSVARDRKAGLVISACVDHANVSACYAMEKLGLHAPYSYLTADRITNKGIMKQEMMRHGIPTSKYFYVNSVEEIADADLRYPVMIKPSDSNGANGVKKAETEAEMRRYLQDALRISRNGHAVVEEFVEGREFSAYCVVKDHKAKLLMTAERISVLDGENMVLKCFATIAPARISARSAKQAEQITTKVAEIFGLDNTPLYIQAIETKNGIFVIEFAPRVGGGLSYLTIRENTGFDILSATIDSYLGEPISLETWHEPQGIFVINIMYGQDGVFDRLEGAQQLLADAVIKDIVLYKTPGTVLEGNKAGGSRIGAFIVCADNETELCEKVHTAYGGLRAYGAGREILRRDLSLDTHRDLIGL